MKKYIKPILEIEEYNIKLNIALSSTQQQVFDDEDNVLNDQNIYNWEW